MTLQQWSVIFIKQQAREERRNARLKRSKARMAFDLYRYCSNTLCIFEQYSHSSKMIPREEHLNLFFQ